MSEELTLDVWCGGGNVTVKCRETDYVSLVVLLLGIRYGEKLVMLGDGRVISGQKKAKVLGRERIENHHILFFRRLPQTK